MKPRKILASSPSSSGLTIDLVEHDSRFFLECEGRQLDAAHLSFPATQLITLLSRPFRPARQPRLIFLGLGFGHAIRTACEVLPQEKASFVVFPESTPLPGWLSQNLPEDPLDDPRVLIEDAPPLAPLSEELNNSQAIIADLDHLEAFAPKDWSFISDSNLFSYYERLKTGGLLGLISTRPLPDVEKALRKTGFELTSELVPISGKSKRNRTLYLARKGHYQRTH